MIFHQLSRLLFFFFISISALLSASWEENLKNLVNRKKIPTWMNAQIKTDLDRCSPGSFQKQNIHRLDQEQLWNFDPSVVHISIVSGKAEFTPFGAAKTSERLPFVEKAIENLCSILPLPDVEFAISLHDSVEWYLPTMDTRLPIPLFVFARHSDAHEQILIPDWEIFRGYESLLEEVRRAYKTFPWEQRQAKAVWRGTTTGANYTIENYRKQLRTKLVEQSFAHPSLIDARFNFICQPQQDLKEEMERYLGKTMSIYEQLRYKYQILIDGNTSGFSRTYWQLFSNSLIFKQDSPNIQWYYGALEPYKHFIPFARNSSNLAEKVAFAKKNDKAMKQIAANAASFARHNLKTEDIYLYLYLVITEFAKRQALADAS